MKKIFKSKEWLTVIFIFILSVIITVKNPNFLTKDNLLTLFRMNSVIGIMAIGMTLAILTGGIDVSVAGNIAVTAMIVGEISKKFPNLSIIFLILIGFTIGFGIGSINGILISIYNFSPIIITLGTLSILNGGLMYLSKGNWIKDLSYNYIEFGDLIFLGIPIQIIILILVSGIVYLILKYTTFGRYIYAIGGDENSAMVMGINVKRIKYLIYAILGGIVGISAVIHTSIVKQVDPTSYTGIELTVIAIVVLGGANINGGYATIMGTILGLILLSIINNGMIIMHIPIFWQKIVMALIILLAVSSDVIQRKIKKKNNYKVDIL